MKQFYLPLIITLLGVASATVPAHGQTDNPEVATDSVMPDILLGEITVAAPKVVHKADMDVLYPSKRIVAASQNGLSLLSHLMIPSLSVNEMMGTVKTAGQDVEIRVNGRKVSTDELLTILPSSVKRVEWIDNPGLRYGDATAVLNVIVANPTLGGSLMAMGIQAFNQPWGNGNLDLKLNNGRSQWAIGVQGRYVNKVESSREYSETFTYSDGTEVTRTETPVDGSLSQSHIRPQVSYNYINPDKTILWVGVSGEKGWPTERVSAGIMQLSNAPGFSLLLNEKEASSGFKPRLEAYVEQRLPHKQTVVVDVNGSLFNGRSTHDYVETDLSADNLPPMTDVHTFIRERNHTINAEADYIKEWKGSRLSAGVKYNAIRSCSTRENGKETHQQQDKTYLFSEYYRQLGAFSMTAGLGAQYIDLDLPESGKGSSSWLMRPKASVSYRFSNSSRVRVNFTTWQTAPTLTQTDPSPQQIDGFQYRIGNPDLHPYTTYRVSAQYNFVFPRVNGKIEGRMTRLPDAIAPLMEWEGDRLITTFENGNRQTSWQLTLSPQIEVIPEYLTLSGTLRYYTGRSAATGYSHTYHGWSGTVNLMATYRSFMLTAMYEENPTELSGETLTMGEKSSILAVGYRWKGLMAIVGVFMPFNRYSMASWSLNRYNKNSNVLRSKSFDMMPCIQVSYNFNWGKQKKEAGRRIDSDSSDDSFMPSKAAGR
ncbi:MAG: outer membrane beta-barrel protein [Staphylococcus sp.]|nr:outer membrane beta-barrel protein [Staphylococcus sp.]